MNGLLWRLKVCRAISVLLLILFCSCTMPGDPIIKESSYIDSYQINFNEDSNELYIALDIINYQLIDSVVSEFYKTDSLYYIFPLNDSGINGDILPKDGMFSIIESMNDFEYGSYSVINRLIDVNGKLTNELYSISILENNLPEIVEAQVPEIFYLGIEDWVNLNISVLVSDIDGISDVDYVRYMVNTDYLTKDNLLTEECDHYNLSEEQYNGYVSDPSWIMEYNTSVDDSVFQYITSIPMRPSIECGGYGIVLFKFLVIDESGASSELSDVILEIISCGDGICTAEYENCLLCNQDCGECDD